MRHAKTTNRNTSIYFFDIFMRGNLLRFPLSMNSVYLHHDFLGGEPLDRDRRGVFSVLPSYVMLFDIF